MNRIPLTRQAHLPACYGKTNFGTRVAAFVEQGVAGTDWSICEWCALNGCCKDKKLEILIRSDQTFSCDCDADHPRADHEDQRNLVDSIKAEQAVRSKAKQRIYDLEAQRFEGVIVDEPLSKRQRMQTHDLLQIFRGMFALPSGETPPCPGDEKDYELTTCSCGGNHKRWVRKTQIQIEAGDSDSDSSDSSDSDLNPPLPEPEAGAPTTEAVTAFVNEHNTAEFKRLAEAIKEKDGIHVYAPVSTPQ